MKISDYPILVLYRDQIHDLVTKDLYLACLVLIGVATELLLREIMSDEWTPAGSLNDTALAEGKVSDDLHKQFKNVIRLRNKYVHVTFNKMKESEKLFKFRKDRTIECLTENNSDLDSLETIIHYDCHEAYVSYKMIDSLIKAI